MERRQQFLGWNLADNHHYVSLRDSVNYMNVKNLKRPGPSILSILGITSMDWWMAWVKQRGLCSRCKREPKSGLYSVSKRLLRAEKRVVLFCCGRCIQLQNKGS